MATPTPTAQHWTFRLKNGRTTVLISALPTTSFTEIKTHLIAALLATGRTELGGHSLKSLDSATIELATPVDKWDMTKGWVAVEIGDDEDGDEPKGKGRPKKSKVINTSPQGAGLKDGGALAFRFKGEETWEVDIPSYDEEPAESMDED